MKVSPWFPYVRPRPDAALRLFCLPHSGAAASTYRAVQDQLPGVEVWAVQLPGREGRLRDPAYRHHREAIPAIVEAMLPHLDQPYAIFGHSMGALLGYLVTKELEARGVERLPELLVASGTGSPSLPRPPEATGVGEFPDDRFIEALRKLDGTPSAVLDEPELLALLMPILRADFNLVDSYQHAPGTPKLKTPILVLAGAGDAMCTENAVGAWGDLTEQFLGAEIFPGGHFYLQNESREPFFDALRRALATG